MEASTSGGPHPSKGQRSKPLQEDFKAAPTISFVNHIEKVGSKLHPPTSWVPSSSRGGSTPVESPMLPGHEAVTTNELHQSPSNIPSRVTQQHHQGHLARHVKRDHPAALEDSKGPSGSDVLGNVTEKSADGPTKGKRRKDPQRSAVMSIQPGVMELNGYDTSDGQSPPPAVLVDAVVRMSRKRPREEETEESEVLHCPDCPYWARTPVSFHEHYVTHKGAKAFKCSGCDETFKLYFETKDHILNKKADPKHRKAQVVAAHPFPTHNYVAFRRFAAVPVGAVDGWNPSRVANAQQENPGDSSGPASDQLYNMEAFPVSSRPPDAKRKKTVRMDSAEEAEECLKEMDQLESGIQEDFRSLEKGKKSNRTESGVLRNRMEVLKGEVEAGEIRVKELQARREELDEKIKEAVDEKIKAELNARTRQCKSLQLRLQASNPGGPKVSPRALEEADEAFRCAEAEVKRMESKLRDLQARKEDLVRQVEEATKSVAETGRKLDAIKKGRHLARHVQWDPPAGHQGNGADPSGVVAEGEKLPAGSGSGQQYRCNECDFSTPVATNFRKHRKRHEHPGRVQCPHCTYSADNEFFIGQHIKKDHISRKAEEVSESFAETGRKFDEMKAGNQQLAPNAKPAGHQGHSGPSGVVAKKEKPADTAKGPTPSGSHRCKDCDYSTSDASHYRTHRKRHEHPGRFHCPLCSYSAYTEIVVEEHLTKNHSGDDEVPFSCSLCKFRCKSSFTLEGHKARHQLKGKDDQHRCILCSYSAGSPNHLIAHMSTGHYLGIFPWDNEGLNLHSSRNHPDDVSPSTNKSTDESKKEEPRPGSKTEEVPVYHCPVCPCWKRKMSQFHYHILGHKSSSGFKCSKCDYSGKNNQVVFGHIRQEKEANNGTHSSARIVFQPVPDHRYAAYLRPAVVPKGVYSGRSLLTTKEKKQEPARMREDQEILILRRKAVAMEGKVVEALEEAEGISARREKLKMQGGLDGQSLEKEDEELAVELTMAKRSRMEAEKELQLLQEEVKSLVASSTTSS